MDEKDTKAHDYFLTRSFASRKVRKQLQGKVMIIHRKSQMQLARKMMLYAFYVYALGLILYGLTSEVSSMAILIPMQCVEILILVAVLYNSMWYEGDLDYQLVHFSRVPYDAKRGVKIGLLSAIPALVVYLMLIIAFIFKFQWLYVIYQFCNALFYVVIQGTTSSVYIADVQWWHLLLFLSFPAIQIAAVAIGYQNGYKGARISRFGKMTNANSDNR